MRQAQWAWCAIALRPFIAPFASVRQALREAECLPCSLCS